MLEKFKISIILILIFLLAFFISISPIAKVLIDKAELDKSLIMSIGDENTTIIENVYFDKQGYYPNISFEIQESIPNYNNLNVYVDDIEIVHAGLINEKGPKFLCRENRMNISELDKYISDGKHKVTIKYIVPNSNFIYEYSNESVLRIKYFEKFIYKDMKLEIPNQTKNFNVANDKVAHKKINEKEYLIDLKEMKNDINIIMDANIFMNTFKINSDYKDDDIKVEKKIENIIIGLIIGFSIINLIGVCNIVKNRKSDKTYHKDTNDVVDIIFAEYMIDKKINASNLIMSIIVQQIVRGNIKFENDKLILKKQENKSRIKNRIVNMFFSKNNVISARNLFSVFSEEDIIERNLDVFNEIKQEINNLFYKHKLYNEKCDSILKNIRKFSKILSGIIVMYFLLYKIFGITAVILALTIIIIKRLIQNYINYNNIIKKYNKNYYYFKKYTTNNKMSLLMMWGIILVYTILMICSWNFKIYGTNIIELIVSFVVIFINYIVVRKSKIHVFSEKGLIEYAKIKGLNDYIKDYSLMEQRDIDATVIWDDYLTYATAFGITNRVTQIFSECLMNVAEKINKINKIMLIE